MNIQILNDVPYNFTPFLKNSGTTNSKKQYMVMMNLVYTHAKLGVFSSN
jgi:hypothetical protein